MSCKRITKTNGEVSQLFDTLYNLVNDENIADELYSYFYTQEFIEMFGDFVSEYNSTDKDRNLLARLDENYEPELIFNERLNKYYFLDSNNEKIYYPYTKTGIAESFETNDIQTFAKSLALNYYKDNIKLDFENLSFINEDGVTLKNYIRDYINNKIEELYNSDNADLVLKGIALENTKEHLDEWVDEVKSFYNTLKISYAEDTLEEQEVEHMDDMVRRESFLKNSKDNVSNNIKLFLSLLESDEINSFGDKSFVDFDDVYSTLNRALKNKVALPNEDIYEIYLETIKDLGIRKPYFNQLYDYLSSDLITDIFKNQFSSAFNLHRNNFLGTEFIIDENGNKQIVTKNLSDVNARKNNILNQWLFNYTELNPKGIESRVDSGISLINKEFKNINTEEELIPILNSIKSILNKLGVEFTQQGFDYYLSDFQFKNPGVDFKKRRLLNVLYNTKRALKNKDNVENLFKDQQVFVEMADAESFFQKEGSDASMYSVGKNKWIYSLPSYIDIKVETWKKDRDSLLKLYNSTNYTKGSYYMKYLLALDVDEDTRIEESKKRINDIEIGIFNSFQKKSESQDAVDNKDIKYTDSLVDYLNKILGFKTGKKVYYKTALAGDKSTEYQINYGNISIETNAVEEDNTLNINDEVLEIFYEYFKADYNRIRFEKEALDTGDIKPIMYYHTNGNAFKSQIFPSLSNNEIIKLYDVDGIPLYENLDQIKEQIKTEINNILHYKIKETKSLLVKEGIFENNLIDNSVYNTYNNNFTIAADFFVNSAISLIEYAKMFTGDTAYYKHGIDYKKRVPATYTDGLYLRITEPQDEKFNVAVLPSQEIPVPTLDNMKEMLSKEVYSYYENVNTTDAQAWITPERWAFIMQKLGKWDNNIQNIYDKFFQDKPVFTEKELSTLAQPLKGVYFNVDETGKPVYLKYSQAVLLPNLVKGTELEDVYNTMKDNNISELVAEDGVKVGAYEVNEDITENIIELDNRYWKLQQQLPTKKVKDTDIGSQIQKNIFFGLVHNLDTNFNVDDDIYTGNELIDYINDLFSNMSTLGKKNLFETLSINPDTYTIENEDYLYDALIEQLSSRNDIPNNFVKALEVGLSPYGIPGFFQTFQNVFSSLFNKRVIKYQSNGGEFIQMSDYGVTRDEAKKQNIVWTPWFKDTKPVPPKVIGKNKETGKNIIEPGGILLSGSFIAKYIPNYKELKSETLFGKLNNNTGKYEGGLIDSEILTNIIGYRIPNQALGSSDALQVVGILPEESGNTIIPYIGTTTKTGSDFDIDKMFLMIPYFKTIIKNKKLAYDFIKNNDISLEKQKNVIRYYGYVGVNEMSNKDVTDYFIEDILYHNEDFPFAKLFRENTDVYDKPQLKYIDLAKDEDGNTLPFYSQNRQALANRVIKVYKSILTNPDVINNVMKPIDLDFIEKDIKKLIEQEDDNTDLDLFNGIKDVEFRQEYKLGKAGLGQNILSLVDSVRGSMSTLTLNNYLGWGNQVNGMTKFDEEFSESIEGHPSFKISDTLTAMVNGFVDIAKDPYIVKGNWVTQTNGVGFMLVRAGVHPYKVNAFLNQPIIKQYVKYRNNVESISIDQSDDFEYELAARDFTRKSPDYTIKQFKDIVAVNNFKTVSDPIRFKKNKSKLLVSIEKSLKDKVVANDIIDSIDSIVNFKSTNIPDMSLDELRSQILDVSDKDIQLSALSYFKALIPFAKNVTATVGASSIDVNGKGKNIISTVIYDNKIKNIYFKEDLNDDYAVLGFHTKLFRNQKRTLLGAVKHNAIDETLKIFKANPKFFFTGSASAIETFNQISKFIYQELLENEALGNILTRDYNTYILSGFPPFSMTRDQKNNLLATMPKRLNEIKKESSNLLIQELTTKTSDKNKFIISMSNAKKSLFYRNNLTNAWEDLLISHPEFAEDLIKYSFIITGFNNNINQFHEYIPYSWFNKNRFNSYLKELDSREEYIDENFIDQFFRNNYENKAIVPNVFKNQIQKLEGDYGFRTGFVKIEGNMNYMYRYVINTDNGPITRYYKLKGFYADGSGVYVRTSVLSGKDEKNNHIKEYNINNNENSIFKENRLKTSMLDMNIVREINEDPILGNIYDNYSIEEQGEINNEGDPSKNDC